MLCRMLLAESSTRLGYGWGCSCCAWLRGTLEASRLASTKSGLTLSRLSSISSSIGSSATWLAADTVGLLCWFMNLCDCWCGSEEN